MVFLRETISNNKETTSVLTNKENNLRLATHNRKHVTKLYTVFNCVNRRRDSSIAYKGQHMEHLEFL